MFGTSTPYDSATRIKEKRAFNRRETIQRSKYSLFHLFRNFLVDGVAKVLYAAFTPAENDRLGVVGRESPRFRVDADKVKRFPHLFDQFVDIEPFAGGYRDGIWDFVPV
jgi:hypothetical protein